MTGAQRGDMRLFAVLWALCLAQAAGTQAALTGGGGPLPRAPSLRHWG